MTVVGKMTRPGCLALLVLALALPLAAQEGRWKELNAQAGELYKQGDYARGIPVAREAVRMAEATFGPEHPNVALSLAYLGLMLRDQGKYAEAEPVFQRALAIDEKALGPEHPNVARDLNNLGLLYEAAGSYAVAEPLFKRSLAILVKANGPDDLAVGISLDNLARLYEKQGKYADAEPLFKRAADIVEKALGPDHPDVATALGNLAELYDNEGKYSEAEPLLRRALAIDEKALGSDAPGVAADLSNLAELYEEEGKYADAEPLLRRALAIDMKALGPQAPQVAINLSNLAELLAERGKTAEAEALFRRALAIKERAFGPEDEEVTAPLNNLALLYQAQGKYGAAEQLLRRSLAITEKALGPDHPDVATSLNNLAALYVDQGKEDEAEALYRRALKIRFDALGPEHPEVADTLDNLAELYSDRGRYALAEEMLRDALAIREKVLGPDHPDVANALNNLAALFITEEKFAEAEPLQKRALEIQQKALGAEHVNVAYSLNNLAEIYEGEGKDAMAEPLFRRALAIDEKQRGPQHPAVSTDLSNLALFYGSQGQYAQAGPLFDRSLAILAKQFEESFTYMSEKERLGFLATLSYRFPLYFSFVFRFHDKDPTLAGKMYDTVLWEKGFIAQSVEALRARILASGDAQALKLLEQLTEKKSELAKLVSAPPAGNAQQQAERSQRIEQLEKEANDLEKELVSRSSALGEQKRLERVTWQQVRDALKAGEAAVEMVRFPYFDGRKWTETSYYVALVLRRESRQPAFIVLGEKKDLEGAPLDDYSGLVAEPDPDAPPRANSGKKFYAAFWQPLEAELAGATRVYLSPDGALNQVSLGVAPRPDGKLVMDAFDLRTVNSTKDLLRQAAKPGANAAVLVGNPKFDATEAEQRAALDSALAQNGQLAAAAGKGGPGAKGAEPTQASLRSRDLRGGALIALPGTQREVDSVAAWLGQQHWQVQTYTGTQALEERVLSVHGPRVLHLATHGFFESDQKQKLTKNAGSDEKKPPGLEDPMLRSGIYLAGANRILTGGAPPADMEDGILTAFEATQMNLEGTELVVLSACQSGLGQSEAGEGVFGLRRGLQEAGAEAVLMSMWSVPDKETQELMTKFYAKWAAGMDKHQALRAAQEEVRAEVRARDGIDEPFFWGAFVLVGR